MTSEVDLGAKPLLFFDTGMGGLSVLKESRKALPNAPFVYAADYAGLPYGMKSEAELAARIPVILGRLVERYDPELITIACNTASTIALEHVRTALDLPVVGTVPAIKPASQMTKTGTIGLLGTKATIRQPYVDRLATEFASDKKLIRFGAPDLVYAAEAKLKGEQPDLDVIKAAVTGLISQDGGDQIDTIILACTHFPLVKDELQSIINRPVQFVDGAKGIAKRIAQLTDHLDWPQASNSNIFVTTGDLEAIAPFKRSLMKHGLNQFVGL